MHTIKFPLGRLVMTAGIDTLLASHEADLAVLVPLLARHQSGDWGDVDATDAFANDLSVAEGQRILSAYHLLDQKIWIITEADRSATTVLLPSEY